MKTRDLTDDVVLLADCPRPVWDQALCERAALEGVASLLVLDDDRTPYPSGQAGGIWCYVRPFADPDSPSPSELQRASDFVAYERRHGRKVGIWVGYDAARDTILNAVLTGGDPRPEDRPLPHDSCCCRPYHDGCDGRLVCHAAPVDAVERILRSGRLLSKRRLTGSSLAELARRSGFGDPPDCFDYVCLANGNCVAPDIVVNQKRAGKWLPSEQVDTNFYPGARFFFDTVELFRHPRAAWDFHPVKIQECLELEPYLVAVVAPTVLPDGTRFEPVAPPGLRERVVFLDHRKHFGLAAWSNAAFEAAMSLQGRGA